MVLTSDGFLPINRKKPNQFFRIGCQSPRLAADQSRPFLLANCFRGHMATLLGDKTQDPFSAAVTKRRLRESNRATGPVGHVTRHAKNVRREGWK
jgi:hypothetical protein